MSEDASENYQKVLNRLGARANAKPAFGGGLSLELVPKTSTHVCPGCRHTTTLEEGEAPPAICPECGLVFHKYRSVQEKKAESEAIRNRLGKIHAMREESEEQQLKQEEEERRRQQLEEQVRKEMGLRGTDKKKQLKQWGAVAAILTLGLGLGAVGNRYIPGLLHPPGSASDPALADAQDPLATMASDITDQLAPGETGPTTDPLSGSMGAGGKISEEQLAALSSAIVQETATPGITTASGGTALPSTQTSRPSPTTAAFARQDAFGRVDVDDLEWRWLIEQSIQTSLDAGALADAETLTNHLSDAAARETARTRIAASHACAGRDSEANALILAIVERLSQEPTASQRVERWTAIAPILADARRRATASHFISQASDTAVNIEDAGDQAHAWGVIALAQARMGLRDDAQHSLVAASRSLKQPMGAVQRVRAAAELGRVFDALGSKDNARRILEQAELSASQISAGTARDRVMEHVTTAWAEIGDLEHAAETTRRLAAEETRDGHLFRLLQARVFAGDDLDGASLVESISSASLRARAFAHLGLASRNQGLSGQHFRRALQDSERVDDVLAQIEVQAEIARLMTHAGLDRDAYAVFARAEKRLQAMTAGRITDLGWTSLARHRARALDTSGAAAYVQRIQDQALRASTQDDLAAVSNVIRDIKTP